MGFKRQINARLPDNLHELIAKRARELEETQGGYLTLIAEWWLAQGGPPVNPYEARVLARTKSKSAREGGG